MVGTKVNFYVDPNQLFNNTRSIYLDCDNPLIVEQDYIVDKEVKRCETYLVRCIIIYEGDYGVVKEGETIKCQQLVYQGYIHFDYYEKDKINDIKNLSNVYIKDYFDIINNINLKYKLMDKEGNPLVRTVDTWDPNEGMFTEVDTNPIIPLYYGDKLSNDELIEILK